MICDRIRTLRNDSNLSQAELARKLSVTRSSVNAWEMGLSAPSAQCLIGLANLFHCTTDYILGLEKEETIVLSKYDNQETQLIRELLSYIDEKKSSGN